MGELRFSINAKEAQNEIRGVTEQIQQLNSAMNEAAKSKDWASFTSMASAMNNLETYRRNVNNEANGIQSNLPMQNNVGNLFNNTTGIVNSVGNGLSAAGSGSVSGMINSATQGAGGITKLLSGLGLGVGASAGILGGLALAGGVAVGVDKTSKVWEESMDDAVLNNTLYNDRRFNLDAKENSRRLRNRYNSLASLKTGTQYSTDEVVELQNAIAKYGFTIDNVDENTQAILYAQHNTGANRDTLSRLVGMQNLYGYNGAMAVQNAYQGLKDSGMTDARFDEFLDGIQKAMEEGISKGFVGSVEDIVNNVSLFSKLSGGATIWSGSAGADRVQKISSGFGSAVNLNSMNDMMMYGAAQGVVGSLSESDYINLASKSNISVDMLKNDPSLTARLIMEQGSNGAFFTPMLKNYVQNVRSQYAGMPEYELQTYMKSFNLNTTGAAQLQSLMNDWSNNGYSTDIAEAVQNIISSPENKSTETNYHEDMNRISDEIKKVGQVSLDIKEVATNRLSRDVAAIRRFLIKDVVPTEELNDYINITEDLATNAQEKEVIKDTLTENIGYYPTSVFGGDNKPGAAAILLQSGYNSDLSYNAWGNIVFESGYANEVAGQSFKNKKGNPVQMLSNLNSSNGTITDKYDNIFKTLAAEAMFKSGPGNEIEDSEIQKVLDAYRNNTSLSQYYGQDNNEGLTRYIQELKSMLKELFGTIEFTSKL